MLDQRWRVQAGLGDRPVEDGLTKAVIKSGHTASSRLFWRLHDRLFASCESRHSGI